MRRRGILTLLASLGPSHRTPAMCPVPLSRVPEEIRDTVAANRRFFRHLVK
jgi:hypothetical protein